MRAMGIEKGKITGQQLMFLAAGFIQGSVLLILFTAGLTKHDTWLVVLSGLAVTVPFILSYAALAKRFPGMNLAQINDAVYGKIIGKTISLYYSFFFLMTLSLNIRDLGDFYTTFLMPETPLMFFLIVFAATCAYAVSRGIEVLARVSHLFVIVAFGIVISTFLLLLNRMDFSNFLPVFDMPFKTFIQGTHIISAIPFGELVVILTITAALNDTRHAVKNIMLGLLLGAATLLVIAVRNTAVLGNTETILISPSFQATRLIDFGSIFTRMDILMGVGQTVVLFLKCSMFYYALVVSISQLLGLKTYIPLVLPLGGIAVILSATIFHSTVEHTTITQNTGIIYLIPLLYVFPPLTLLIAGLRKLPGRKGGKREC